MAVELGVRIDDKYTKYSPVDIEEVINNFRKTVRDYFGDSTATSLLFEYSGEYFEDDCRVIASLGEEARVCIDLLDIRFPDIPLIDEEGDDDFGLWCFFDAAYRSNYTFCLMSVLATSLAKQFHTQILDETHLLEKDSFVDPAVLESEILALHGDSFELITKKRFELWKDKKKKRRGFFFGY